MRIKSSLAFSFRKIQAYIVYYHGLNHVWKKSKKSNEDRLDDFEYSHHP